MVITSVNISRLHELQEELGADNKSVIMLLLAKILFMAPIWPLVQESGAVIHVFGPYWMMSTLLLSSRLCAIYRGISPAFSFSRNFRA